MNKKSLLCGLGAIALAVTSACHVGDASDADTLSVTETATAVTGTFATAAGALTFSSAEVTADEFDVEITLRGMTLAAILHRDAQVAEVDGFADDGSETQMLESDRAVLAAFAVALADAIDTAEHPAGAILYRTVSSWSQTPDTVPLQRQVASSEDRAYVSLCSNFGAWVLATHDGNKCNAFDAKCTSTAQVGNRLAKTRTNTGSGWTTAVPDHASNPLQTGDCYGNCGAGCPGGNQTLTLDCHDHDQCVRNGHSIVSFYCNDEFVSASDDEFFAPRCSGT